ncbi:MAG: energy transducer TonB, partial [Silanimonas sp.]
MRTVLRLALPISLALGLIACGDEAPPAGAPAPSPAADATTNTPAADASPTRDAAALDTATLRQRASTSLAANRLYSPAGDNAVEDYLALREREPGDAGVQTALVDLAPYVMIGAEQATAAEDFVEAQRLIALLARVDAEAPAVPRLREALAAAEAVAAQREADAQALADAQAQADAARLAAEAQRTEASRRDATPGAADATV